VVGIAKPEPLVDDEGQAEEEDGLVEQNADGERDAGEGVGPRPAAEQQDRSEHRRQYRPRLGEEVVTLEVGEVRGE